MRSRLPASRLAERPPSACAATRLSPPPPRPREDLERLIFFEAAREQAEKDWSLNPNDTHVRIASHRTRVLLPRTPLTRLAAQALTRWGGALLELAHFRQGGEAVEYIELAVTKFEAALAQDPRKHDALWCLGNALTSQGFLFADGAAAAAYFSRARGCFERALAEEPANEVYRKALDMTARAPALHAELQKQFAAQQQAEAGSSGRRGTGRGWGGEGEAEAGDWVIHYAGYAILAALAVGWTVMADRAGKS